jgi:WD40 repeat protein
MKARLIRQISTNQSWDHYFLPEISRLIIFGHEGPAILYDTSSATTTEVLNIGRVVSENGGMFVNAAARSDKIAAFADYCSNPNILVLADMQSGCSKAIITTVGNAVHKIAFSPRGTLLALGSGTEKSKVCIYDVQNANMVASFDGCEPLSWGDDDTLFYWNRFANSVYCKRINSGTEQSVAPIPSGYLSAILYCNGNVFFSVNQYHGADYGSELFRISMDDSVQRSLAKFGAGIEFLSQASKDQVVVASAWHGDSEENGKIRLYSLIDNSIHIVGIFDSGYGHEELYSPYATCSIESDVCFAWRSRRAKVFIAKFGMSPHEVLLPNYYPELDSQRSVDQYVVNSVHMAGLNDKVCMSIGQGTNILVYEIENT